MDFSKEIIVKTEFDIEDSNTDWCINVGAENVNEFTSEGFSLEELSNLQRCCHCNELYFDSNSLYQHNLKHLQVYLEKLPDKILYCKPDVPQNQDGCMIENRDIKLEFPEPINTFKVSIKSEILESSSESIEKFSDTDAEENSNDDVPITKREYTCSICKNVFNYKHWHAHMKNVHSNTEIECDLCKKVYKCLRNYRRHPCLRNKVHSKTLNPSIRKIVPKIFECFHCNSVFQSKDCMQKHLKNVHSGAVRCKICNSRLASALYLAAHVRRVHYDDGKVHSCDICGKIFKSPRYVRVHMKNSHYVSSKNKTKALRTRSYSKVTETNQ